MKPTSSPFQLILLGTFGALAVAGVLVFALAVSKSTGQQIGSVTIWGTLDQSAWSAVLRQIAEENAALSQVTYEQKDPVTYRKELTDALASGKGPDLFIMMGDSVVFDAGKAFPIPYEIISRDIYTNLFIDATNVYMTADGVLAVPILVDPLVLYWNRDLMAAAGLATPPKFWYEVPVMSQKMTRKDDAGVISKSGIAFGEYRNVGNAKDVVSLLILQAGGQITARDSQGNLVPALSSRVGGSSESAESALDFFTQFADPAKDIYAWNRSLLDAQDAFAAGDVGLYVGFASEKAIIARKNPNLNFAVSPVPQLSAQGPALTVARTYGLATSRTGARPNVAASVAYTLSDPGPAAALSLALGLPSARRDILRVPATSTYAMVNSQAILARSWIDPDPQGTADAFRAMIEDTVSGAVTVSEGVQRADQQIGKLIGL
ncbi:extracellular solute-binding protein [Candidatus Kaiserbacteria bacterium]|nr:extracellular solute-binding protein [Candidatus Kaiserbacteria bacterium]